MGKNRKSQDGSGGLVFQVGSKASDTHAEARSPGRPQGKTLGD